MKSSTLHRANLSKERKAFLEELKAQNEFYEIGAPNVYKRTSKQQELDALWKMFKINQKDSSNPGVYLTVGFIAGAISMFMMTALLSFGVNSDNSEARVMPIRKNHKAAEVKIIPADEKTISEEASAGSSESYTVKDGDTLERMIIRFYGKYDSSKVSKIKEANSLDNPNKLKVGQVLTIPLD